MMLSPVAGTTGRQTGAVPPPSAAPLLVEEVARLASSTRSGASECRFLVRFFIRGRMYEERYRESAGAVARRDELHDCGIHAYAVAR